MIFKILREKDFELISTKARKIVAFLMSTLSNLELLEAYHQEIEQTQGGKQKEIRIEETVRSDFSPLVTTEKEAILKAEELFEKACHTWKTRSALELSLPPTSQYCGEPLLERLEDEVLQSDGEVKLKTLGFEFVSKALLTFNIVEQHDVLQTSNLLIKGQRVEHPHSVEGAIGAYGLTVNNLKGSCTAWKEFAQETYKMGFIYFVCDDPTRPRKLQYEKESPDCKKHPNHKHTLTHNQYGRVLYVINTK